MFFFFFFQAEDGIRDFHVTGVQTCALPISAFQSADVTLKQRLVNQRLIPNAMEPRNTVAQYNPATGDLTVTMTSQNPHIHRFLLSVILGLPEHRIRVIAPEVGGGFGSKIHCYPEEAVTSYLAMQLGRPMKWSEDRREN